MALNKIQGEMLEDNLLRNGQDLAVETDLLYISTTGRVGIKTATPRSELDVNGPTWLNNIRFYNDQILLDNGSELSFDLNGVPASFTGSKITNVQNPTDQQDVVTVNYLENIVGGINADRISSSNSELVIEKVGGITTLDYAPNGVLKAQLTDTEANLTLNTNVTGDFSVTGVTTLADTFISNNSISTPGASGLPLQLTSDSGLISIVGSTQISSTTADKVVFTDSGNNIATSTSLTFNGSDLVLNGSASIDNIFIDNETISSAIGLNLVTNALDLAGTSSVDISTTGANNITLTTVDGIVDIDTVTSLKIPVGTTLERPGSASAGYMRFNTLLGQAEIHDGVDWNGFSPDFAGITFQEIIPDGVSQIYALDEDCTSATIIVSINGIIQTPDEAYNVVGQNIIFASPPLTTDIVSIRFLSAITTVSAITDAAGDTKVQATNGIITLDVVGDTAIEVDINAITVDRAFVPKTNLGSNIGTPSENFNIIYTNQIYTTQINGVPADVAENFVGDKEYESGTVLVLGGDNEVTECSEYADSRVAGIVSTEPAYILNSEADTPQAIALCGRVPCKVVGPVHRGDLLTTSDTPGHAIRYTNDGVYRPGVILGKAMEASSAETATILVLVTMM